MKNKDGLIINPEYRKWKNNLNNALNRLARRDQLSDDEYGLWMNRYSNNDQNSYSEFMYSEIAKTNEIFKAYYDSHPMPENKWTESEESKLKNEVERLKKELADEKSRRLTSDEIVEWFKDRDNRIPLSDTGEVIDNMLREYCCYNDYYGIISSWSISEEDKHLVHGKHYFGIPGPDEELYYYMNEMTWKYKNMLDEHFADTRTREQKYYDSIKEYNEKYDKEHANETNEAES